MIQINSHTGWQPLREVLLGDVYPVDFYYDHESEVRAAFEAITEITKQDLGKIQSVLESKGISVHRPRFSENRDEYLDNQGMLIKPPIMPRDTEMVLDAGTHPFAGIDMGSRPDKEAP